MTPEQALALLDNLVAQIALTRPQHAQAQQAVAILANVLASQSTQEDTNDDSV